MRVSIFLVMTGLLAATAALAQFGGRAGDAVILVVSAKGNADFQVVPSSTTNTPSPGQSGFCEWTGLAVRTDFDVLDPTTLFDEPFGPDFPGESRRLMHCESGDVFNMIVQREGIQSPHQFLQGPVKVIIFQGLLRLYLPDKPPVDTPVGFFAPFPDTIDFGPNEPLFPGIVLMWTPYPGFPVAKKDSTGYISPLVPAGSNGIEYELRVGTFIGIVPWVGLDQKYAGAGWPQGIDTKLLEKDTDLGVTWQIVRLRPGRTSPLFRINANTHVWALSGSTTITPVNATPSVIANPGCEQPCPGKIYAFVPPGFAIRLSNPAVYEGPR